MTQLLDDIQQDTPDELITSRVNIGDTQKHLKRHELLETTEEQLSKPGIGVRVGQLEIPIPVLPKRRGRKTGKSGNPPHKPTDEMKQYVFDTMLEGYQITSIAHNLGISYMTLVKYYSYELDLAEASRHRIADGVLLRNLERSEIDKGYQKSLELYYKRYGLLKDRVDVTSGGEKVESNNFVLVPVVKQTKTVIEGEVIDEDIPEID